MKRYDMFVDVDGDYAACDPYEDPKGNWVKHEDVSDLRAKLEAAKTEIRECRTRINKYAASNEGWIKAVDESGKQLEAATARADGYLKDLQEANGRCIDSAEKRVEQGQELKKALERADKAEKLCKESSYYIFSTECSEERTCWSCDWWDECKEPQAVLYRELKAVGGE